MNSSSHQKTGIKASSDVSVSTGADQLQKLRYDLSLIERKEQAFKLRTVKVNEVEEGKAAMMMKQPADRLRDEEILMETEDQARKLRLAGIQSMKTKLDQHLKEERLRKAKESMIQEIFEEDAERMKFELASKIEKLASGEETGGKLRSDAVSGKRKSIPDHDDQREAKRIFTGRTESFIQPEAGQAPDISQTIPSSSMIPETVFLASQSQVTDFPDHHKPKQLWSCSFCGKLHACMVDHRGKDVLCDCSPRSKILWEVHGGKDNDEERDSYSDCDTVS